MKNTNDKVVVPTSIFSDFFTFLQHHGKWICIVIITSIITSSVTVIACKFIESREYVNKHISTTSVVNSPGINKSMSAVTDYHWMDESQANRNGPNDWWAPYVHLTYEQKLEIIRFINTVPNYDHLSGKEILSLYFQNKLISESEYNTILENCKEL